MRVKICGLRYPEQGKAIAALGIDTLGFICVASSPRYVTPEQIQGVIGVLPSQVRTIGVFANASLEELKRVITQTSLTGIQLHGLESPEFCQRVKQTFSE
ncbi:MAG: phosphoribosylanthranilate isomerase, partial [Microcystaceae cyanobacterium]